MKIKKAVITAASRAQRTLPLQILVDRDGRQKAVLNIIIEEALRAGIEDIGIVVCPGDEAAYAQAAGDHAGRLSFWAQEEPRGYGHAIYCAREFTNGEPFLHMVGDHVYISGIDRNSSTERSDADSRENSGRENTNGHERIGGPEHGGIIERGCARQVVEVACAHACAVSGVQPTREILLPYFGTVGAQRIKGTKELYRIEQVIEKPTPTEAEQSLLVPGLRTGHYLCFFGIHVLTPTVMELLANRLQQDSAQNSTQDGAQERAQTQVVAPGVPASGSLSSRASSVATSPPFASVQLSPVLNELAQREQYLALEVQGLRYPVDAHYGLLTAQLALALSGQDRDEVLVGLCQLLAERQTGTRLSSP